MAVSAVGIMINLIILVVIGILLILGWHYHRLFVDCRDIQSPFCYTVQCPCDDSASGPCFGFAKMPGPRDGTWSCSNNPSVLVDDTGSIVR